MSVLRNIGYLDLSLLLLASWTIFRLILAMRLRVKTTRLNGPSSSSWIFGVSKDLFDGDSGELYEKWAKSYGTVYQAPGAFGGCEIVLTDSRAVAHFYSKDTYTYVNSDFSKRFIDLLLGKGLLWAEGDSHRRQRRTLSPAFVNAAIRSITPVFFDSGYKVKMAWDSLISASGSDEAIIDIQKWMSCVSLDSIGIAGFGHDFGALHGKHTTVGEVFESFSSHPPTGAMLVTLLLGPVIPILTKLPSSRGRLIRKLHKTTQEVSEALLERSRKEKGLTGETDTSRSIIGSLLKAENAASGPSLTEEEVVAQMRVLLVAGFETTSVSLTWALIELSRHQDVQEKLREELSEFSSKDPSYDQLINSLPYLDAVTRETIRLHPPVEKTTRMASSDDAVPLSNPVTTASGERVEQITVARNTTVTVPIRAINRSDEIWGPDAKVFKPERWLDNEAGLPGKAKSVQGYHHILSFVDGPRTCLGRPFAIAEFKAVLSVLIRNYAFSLQDGPETKIELVRALVPRPKVAGEEGQALPMRVRRYEH